MKVSALWQGIRVLPASILLLAGMFYANSLDNGFHYDDSHSIVENYHIRSLAHIGDFFVDPTTFSREPAMAMYRPVVQTTYALNYALGKYRPLGYHLVNIALHGLAALLLYLVISALTGQRLLGWWGGAFFALHPVQSQAVNYISSRAEIMGAVGILAAFYLLVVKKSHQNWDAHPRLGPGPGIPRVDKGQWFSQSLHGPGGPALYGASMDPDKSSALLL